MNPVEAAELRGKVAEAVAGLDGEMQLAVRLRYEHDLSHAQIAEAMDLPETTVSRRLSAAHARLREVLAGAGVAIAMALLERELRAAERQPVPAELAAVLGRLSLEGASAGGGLSWTRPEPRSGQMRLLLVGMMVMLALLVPLAWWVMRPKGELRHLPLTASEESGRGAGAAEAGTTGDPASKGSAASATEDPGRKEASAKFSGRLLDAVTRAPIVGAAVWLERETYERDRVATAATDAEGAFAFSVPPGEYAVGASAAGYVGPQVAYDLIEAEWMNGPAEGERLPAPKNPLALRPDRVALVEGENPPVDLPLGTGVEVRGKVVDAAGRPLAGARVEFSQRGPEGAKVEDMSWDAGDFGCGVLADGRTTRALVTDADGNFRIPAVFRRGGMTFDAACDGYCKGTAEVAVADDAVDVVVVLQAGMVVAGQVLDSRGVPVPGASLHFEDPGRPASEEGTHHLPGHDPASDAEGRFRFADVPAGSRLACALAPGRGYAIVDFSGANPAALRIVLPACDQTITGLVRDTAGNPVPDATVSVWDLMIEDGAIRAHLIFVDNATFQPPGAKGDIDLGFAPPDYSTPRTATSAAGEFKLENLPLGPTRPLILEVASEGFRPKRVRVERSGWVEVALEPRR